MTERVAEAAAAAATAYVVEEQFTRQKQRLEFRDRPAAAGGRQASGRMDAQRDAQMGKQANGHTDRQTGGRTVLARHVQIIRSTLGLGVEAMCTVSEPG